MQNLEHSDGSEENMGQKTTDTLVQRQNDCLVVRVCQEACRRTAKCTDGRRIVAFKRAFVTHRNAKTSAVKRTTRTIGCDGRGREEM